MLGAVQSCTCAEMEGMGCREACSGAPRLQGARRQGERERERESAERARARARAGAGAGAELRQGHKERRRGLPRLAPFHTRRTGIRHGSTCSRECPTLRLPLSEDQRVSRSCQQPQPQLTAPFCSAAGQPSETGCSRMSSWESVSSPSSLLSAPLGLQ